MIGKIQPPNPNVERAISYNERKMDGEAGIRPYKEDETLAGIENGHILETRNVPEGSTFLEEMDRLKLLSIRRTTRKRIQNTAFHMSINPSETDRPLSEREAVALADEIMEGLGYKNQPYRIYKHTDISRMHYHVVSCRAGQDGRKINDSFERMVLRETLKKLAPKYGFTVILNEEEKEAERKKKNNAEEQSTVRQPEPAPLNKKNSKDEEDDKKKKKSIVLPFSRKSSEPVKEQLQNAFEDAMKWNFSTFEQIQALMLRRYNVLAEIEAGTQDKLVLFGTSATGTPVTPPIYEADFGIQMLNRIREKTAAANLAARKEQKKRLETLCAAAAAKAKTYEEFRSIMEQKGVYVVLSWSKEGKSFGVTWLDRATKCAWKGSETGATIAWLHKTAEEKGWTLTKDRYQSIIEKRNAMPSRRKSLPTKTDVAPPKPASTESSKGKHAGGIVDALGKIRGGTSAPGGDPHAGDRKGKDDWDEALSAAAREEAERKKNEGEHSI